MCALVWQNLGSWTPVWSISSNARMHLRHSWHLRKGQLSLPSAVCCSAPAQHHVNTLSCRAAARFGGWQRRWEPSQKQCRGCLAWVTSCSPVTAASLATGVSLHHLSVLVSSTDCLHCLCCSMQRAYRLLDVLYPVQSCC